MSFQAASSGPCYSAALPSASHFPLQSPAVLVCGEQGGQPGHHLPLPLLPIQERLKSDEPDKKGRAASGCQAPRRHPTPARPRLPRVDQQSPSTPPVPGHPLLPILQHQDTEGKGVFVGAGGCFPKAPRGHWGPPMGHLRQAAVTVMSPPPLCMYQGLC